MSSTWWFITLFLLAVFGQRQVVAASCGPTIVLEHGFSNPDGDFETGFGSSIALSGDLAVVSGRNSDGDARVYCYTRENNAWGLRQTLASPANNSYFGASLAISTDTLVVGTPGWPSNPDLPAVYIYGRSGTQWSLQQSLPLPAGITIHDGFGRTVAFSGNTLVVGIPGLKRGGTHSEDDHGAVLVYERTGAVWTQTQQLVPARGPTSFELFGASLAFDGNTIVVGTRDYYSPGGGSVYVFARQNEAWQEQQRIAAPNGVYFTFGNSIALSGDTLFIGNPLFAENGLNVTGPVQVFERNGATWNQTGSIRQSVSHPQDGFGSTIAVEGNHLLISTFPFESIAANPSVIHVFEREGSAWIEQETITNGALGPDSFGRSISISGDRFLTGAQEARDYVGAAYAFKLRSRLRITAPARDEIVRPDEPYTIRFEAPTNMVAVDLYLVQRSLSPCVTRTLIAENVPAAAGMYEWDVPADLLSPSTFVIAVDAADATTETISAHFRVRDSWWLHRVVGSFQQPEYEPFSADEHAFSFLPQDQEAMWNENYWRRDSYAYNDPILGYDPFVGGEWEVRYHPLYFRNGRIYSYPPWAAVVRAFGVQGTYTSLEPWTLGGVVWNQPNPEAALWWNWRLIESPIYNGACYGLSMAMLAAFQDPDRFDEKWLPSGGSATLGALLNSNEVLDAVHALQPYWHGRLQQAEAVLNRASMTPRDVVARLKAMFERDDRDRDRFLFFTSAILRPGQAPGRGAHAVVPVWMYREGEEGSEEGLYTIGIIDPNDGPPGPNDDVNAVLYIDTEANKWWHHNPNWVGDTNTGIYLSMEVLRAFETASTQWAHVLDGNGNPLPAMVKAAGDAEPETFSVSIIGRGGAVTSGAGELRYEGGVLTETLPGGFISFPITGRPSQPDAYVVPSGVSYRAEAIPRTDGIAGVRVSGSAVKASLLQTGAASPTRAVVDLLEDGLSVVSGGPGTFELTALTLANGREFRSLRASGLVATNPASLGLTADAGGFRLAGTAEASSYHLELNSSTGNVSRVFHHPNLLLEAGATHWIRPNWATLGEGPVTIDVDRDGDGQTDETLVVANQAPSTSIWPGWVGGIPPGNPNLLSQNHGFESQPLGTSVSLPPVMADGATFTGWRVFNVDTNSVAFSATLIANASIGTRAMRLGVTNTGGTAGHALDQWMPAMHTPVQPGQRYVVSFDAAWIAGLTTGNLLFQVQEFDSAGGYLGNGLSTLRSVATTTYEKHTFIYQPVNPATAGIGMFFGPLRGVVGATTISLDNVRMVVAPLLVNGDFESSPPATSAGGNGVFVDTTTFLGWRLFSVGSPPITNLTATIVDAGSYTGGQPGSRALRLAVTNTGSPAAHDYGLDNDNARSPVVTGRKYTLSFDAALLQVSGGSLTLNVSVAEFNAAGSFTGTQGSFAPALTADQTFHRHTMTYVVTNPATTQVVIAFRPVTTGQSVLVLDNVEFAPFVADTPTSLTIDVNGATLSLAWPESHLGWRVQSNSVNVANPSAWFDIPGSQSVTNLSLPISPTTPAVYYRLRRP